MGAAQAARLRATSWDWPSWTLDARQRGALELLLSGAYAPLSGFMGEADLRSVRARGRLADGSWWPAPVLLEVGGQAGERARPGVGLALRDTEGVLLAVLRVRERFAPPSGALSGSAERRWLVAGPLEGVELPAHHDFAELRHDPARLAAAVAARGWRRTLVWWPRLPLLRPELAGASAAARRLRAGLLVAVAAGEPSPGDARHFATVRAALAAVRHDGGGEALLTIQPAPTPAVGGGRLLRLVLARNLGGTHLLREPAEGPLPDQALGELGLTAAERVPVAYDPATDAWLPARDAHDPAVDDARGRVTRWLREPCGPAPGALLHPQAAAELRRVHSPRRRQGVVVLLTGLSGSGKSTIANRLVTRLLESTARSVTLLDGDAVRRHLSSELGFSRAHRDLNVLRIGFVAAEVAKHGGLVVCAPIAPYDAVRKQVRAMVAAHGRFVLVHVATPLKVCEQRDRKGLYAKARAGLIAEFTGVSDPYEPPEDAELTVDTTGASAEHAAGRILDLLAREGHLDQSVP